MKTFFEGHIYSADIVSKYDLDGFLYAYFSDDKIGFTHIGYYLPKGKDDPVFILPKVFLDKDGLFLGQSPDNLIDLSENEYLKDNEEVRDTVFGLSTWIYRSIAHYIQRKDGSIGVTGDIQDVVSKREDGSSQTYLDIILELIKFSREHKSLFTFITLVKHQGYNRVHWQKTISKNVPIMVEEEPYYVRFENRKQSINFDEELIVLFFSILNYLREKYSFHIDCEINYDVLKPHEIENMIESCSGTRTLIKIRYKYFTDELVALWNLVYVFFDKSENINSNQSHKEMLLVHKYDRVFEDMIDQLIGDDKSELGYFANQLDGKMVDHMYEDQDLISGDKQRKIYFIADSKYYIERNQLSGESIYKQYTYAKNVIQCNIDLLNIDEPKKGFHYRDNITEGYNITPNFFIRGRVSQSAINDYDTDGIEKVGNEEGLVNGFRPNFQWKNRLFDRDTLPTQEYYINFLFVLASYVTEYTDDSLKKSIREKFRNDLIEVLSNKYFFHLVYHKSGKLEDAIHDLFRELNGKCYSVGENGPFILALEKCYEEENLILMSKLENDGNFIIVKNHHLGDKIHPINVYKSYLEDEDYSMAAEAETPYVPSYSHKENKVVPTKKAIILYGCYRSKEQLDWIHKSMCYNVRLDSNRKGDVSNNLQKNLVDYLVLYNSDNIEEFENWEVTKVHDVWTKEQMKDKDYPFGEQVSEKYYLYHLKEEASPFMDDLKSTIVEEMKSKGKDFEFGAPIYKKGFKFYFYSNDN